MERSDRGLTREWWSELALFYCSKRETSRPKLKAYFKRKIREYRIAPEAVPQIDGWIESILDQLEQKKIIDHERYAGMLHRDLQRRGKGKRYIEQKLKERGLSEEIRALEFNPEDEFENAVALARKTLGRSSVKKLESDHAIRTRVMQKLVASGFDLGLARKAVDTALQDPDR
jgi:regulatory protein